MNVRRALFSVPLLCLWTACGSSLPPLEQGEPYFRGCGCWAIFVYVSADSGVTDADVEAQLADRGLECRDALGSERFLCNTDAYDSHDACVEDVERARPVDGASLECDCFCDS